MDQLRIVRKIACGALLLSAAAAQDTRVLSPFPAGDFHFSGNWSCEGTFRGGKPHKASFTASTILNGKWLQLTEQDIEPKTGYVAEYLLGSDLLKRSRLEGQRAHHDLTACRRSESTLCCQPLYLLSHSA